MISSEVEIAAPPAKVREVVSALPPRRVWIPPHPREQLLDFAKIPEWHSGMVKSITPLAESGDGQSPGNQLHCVMEGFTFDSTITVRVASLGLGGWDVAALMH
jgi:hypothetical protein